MKLYEYSFISPLRGYVDLEELNMDDGYYRLSTRQMAKILADWNNARGFLREHEEDLGDCLPPHWNNEFKEAIVTATFGDYTIVDDNGYLCTKVVATRQLTVGEREQVEDWIAEHMEDGWGQNLQERSFMALQAKRPFAYFDEETLCADDDYNVVLVQYYMNPWTHDNWNVEFADVTEKDLRELLS